MSLAWKAPTSGGSTGRPKLIVSGQDGAIDPALGTEYGMAENGVQLVPGPVHHNAPFSQSMLGFYLGGHLVVLERFAPIRALEAIRTHRVDWVSLVRTMMLRILRVLEAEPTVRPELPAEGLAHGRPVPSRIWSVATC